MRSDVRMMLALASPAAGFADQPSGSRAFGGRGVHVRRARPKAAPVGEMLDYPHKYPPRDPADWSDLMVREITRTESQEVNSLSLLGFSQPFMAAHCLPSGSRDVPKKSLRKRIFPPGSRDWSTPADNLQTPGRCQDMRRAASRRDERSSGELERPVFRQAGSDVVTRIGDSRARFL
jgi:hypothetical protein